MNINRILSWLGAAALSLSALPSPAATGDNHHPNNVIVIPPGPLPAVFLVEKQRRAAEQGPVAGEVLVVRAGDTNHALTVSYHLQGTAQNEVDYQPLLGSVTIPAGAYAAPITVTPIDDTEAEPLETVHIELQTPNAAGTAVSYIPLWPGRATVTIRDNDGGTNRPPVVNLVNPPSGSVFRGPLDVHLGAHADDFEGDVVSVEFFAGQQSLGVVSNSIVPVPLPAPHETGFEDSNLTDPLTAPKFNPNSPTLREGNALSIPLLPFSMVWSNAPVGDHVLTAVATDDQGVSATSSPKQIKVIADTSLPRVEIFARDPVAAETDATNEQNTATFVIHRTGSTEADLNLELRVLGTAELGEDYTGVATTVTLPAGARRTEITILPIDDHLVEGREFIQLQLLPTACIDVFPRPPGCYDLGRHSRATAWIRDNDEIATNRPPVVQILHPHHHSTVVEPERMLLVAAARDNDGTVQSVEFFDGDDSIGVVTVPNLLLSDATGGANLTVLPPWHLEWTNISPGLHIIRAKATDNDGAETTSRPVELRVVSRQELPVVQIETIDAVAVEPGVGNGIPQPEINGPAGAPLIGGTNPLNGVTTPDGSLITGFAGTDGNAVVAPEVLNTAAFRVVRSGDTTEPLTVYLHFGGHARNGVDYFLLSRQVTIPAGAQSETITILPIDDPLPEGPEDVLVTIVHPDFRSPIPGLTTRDYIIGPNNQAGAVIRDNDGTHENRPPEVRLLHPGSGAMLPAGEPVRIMGHAVDVDGYLVQFAALVNNQVVAEENINYFDAPPPGMRATFSLAWTNATPGVYAIRVRARDNNGAVDFSESVTVRVINVNDRTVVTVEAADPDAQEAPNVTNAAGVNPGAYVVRRRGGDRSQNLHVSYFMSGSAVNGVDYHRLTGNVIFGPHETEKRIILMPIDDNRVERTETATLTLTPPPTIALFPPPPPAYLIGEDNRATVLIRDNDEDRNRAPRVVVASPHRQQRFTAPADIEIVVHTRDVDGWVSQLEFFAGDDKLGDSVMHFIRPPEPGHRQRFSLNWTNVPPGDYAIRARATDNLGASSWSDPVPVLVRETNAQPVVNLVARDFIAQEGAANGVIDTATFVVERRGNTNDAITVFLGIDGRAQNGVDYQAIADTLTIPAGETSATITITPIDDNETESSESVVLALIVPPNVRLAYEIGIHARAAAVIGDNDFTLPPIPGDPNQPMADALDDGVVHVVLRADTQEEVIVEGSDNLIDWFEVIRGVMNDGKIDFVEPDALNQPGRYYRILRANAEAAPVAAQRRF